MVRAAFLVALALSLGQTVFLSLVAAPTLFRTFPRERAGEVMSALFPGYYLVGSICGAVLVIGAVLLWRSTRPSLYWSIAGACALLVLAANLYAGAILQPRARTLRDELHAEPPRAEAKAEFDRIHRRAVQLNGFVLLGNLLIAGMVAARLRP
jgi:MFS family permease